MQQERTSAKQQHFSHKSSHRPTKAAQIVKPFESPSIAKSLTLLFVLVLSSQVILNNFPDKFLKSPTIIQDQNSLVRANSSLNSRESSFGKLLIFAEAGKKKKSKSEVVVISVHNAQPKHQEQMYPIFVPTCAGGHGGFGGASFGGGWGGRWSIKMTH